MDDFDFNDPKSFPDKETLSGVVMLKDGSLEVRVVKGPPRITTVTYRCPKNTTMHTWLISLTGPMYPGASHLFLEVD